MKYIYEEEDIIQGTQLYIGDVLHKILVDCASIGWYYYNTTNSVISSRFTKRLLCDHLNSLIDIKPII